MHYPSTLINDIECCAGQYQLYAIEKKYPFSVSLKKEKKNKTRYKHSPFITFPNIQLLGVFYLNVYTPFIKDRFYAFARTEVRVQSLTRQYDCVVEMLLLTTTGLTIGCR